MSDENNEERPGAIVVQEADVVSEPDLVFARAVEGVLDQVTMDVTNTSVPVVLDEDPVAQNEGSKVKFKMPGWAIGLSISGGVILIGVVVLLILRARRG